MSNATKSYFAMHRGLNTEAPLINFPDGFTTEEQNYELTIQGARRRRAGLAIEAGGEEVEVTGYQAGDIIRSHDWENVAGIPTINYIVLQVGYTLHIFEDTNPISPTKLTATIDLRVHRAPDATDLQISTHPLESAFGRGHLFFFGKYTVPLYVAFDPDTETFSVTQIPIRERDFVGIDDGISNSTTPTSVFDTHRYNLRNRGWTDAFINAYNLDRATDPSKAMIPWLGLERALTPSDMYNSDGVRAFNPAKLESEYFQDASAPMGHIIIDTFDTTTYDDTTNHLAVTTWSISPPTPGGVETVTITVDGNHGLVPTDTAEIEDLFGSFITYQEGSEILIEYFSIEGTYTVQSTPTASSFTIQVTFPNYPFIGWYNQFTSLGTFVGGAIPTPTGLVVEFRPKAGAFFAGRSWFAGIDLARLTGRVYFSQVIESDAQYGKCYQIADPTDERLSDLGPADGGVIVIPEASNVLKLVPYNSSLLVFASNGVWEIGPGDLGYFAATSYSVRKVTDSGTVSAGSVILMDNLPVYWGVTDIYGIAPNPQTGFLEVSNLSQQTINTFYNAIPLDTRRLSTGVYDDLSKRIVWLYGSATSLNEYSYDRALVYDLRMRAFVPMAFAYESENYLAGVALLKEAGEVSKVKYLGYVNNRLVFGETSNYDDYTDFGLAEPECFLVTGYDSLRSPASFKYAPVVWVFSGKTEQGYTESLDPIRPSSTIMQARWEWADSASAGRWGREQEVYRHSRTYVPEDSSDTFDDGVPVVVTKNKLRGKGRVLQLKFTAGAGKDSHLLGWKTNYYRIEK